MTETDDEARETVARLLELVEREDIHLLAVRERFLDGDCRVDAKRMADLLADPEGEDRLESFGAKFSRMQDTVIDKLLPRVLYLAGERVAAAIDNLGRAERIGLVTSADDWMAMRHLRNRLVHKYIDRPEEMAPVLERACRFTETMHADFRAISVYALETLEVPAPSPSSRA